ncbi:MAG: ATP-dependent helicase, partial [Acidimicrobiales bacterium]
MSAATHRRAATRRWGGRFHAIANRLLRPFARAAGVDTGFTVLDRADTVDMLAMVRTTEGLAERGRRFPRAATVAAIYSRMVNSQAKLDEVLAADFGWCADHADTLRSMFVAYTERKRSSRVLDYDDLLLFWRGLTAGPAGDELRAMFSHVLIDEYQDTNRIQADIVSGMCGPATEVCAVGDDAQSIYGFRAATVANMWTFADRFPGARTITLEQSYRSTMPVLAVANAVLAQPAAYARAHHPKTLWSTRRGGPRPGLIVHHDEGDQSRSVARSVLEARERGIDLRHQAVLFRAGHHSDGLELELARHDIPFVKYGGLEYLETAHVKDLLALLRLLDNPADELAWHRVLGLLAGVGPATIRRITAELGLDDHAGADPGARAELSGRDALGRFLHAPPRFPPAAADQAQELRAALPDGAGAERPPSAQLARLAGFSELVVPARYDNAPARIADLGQLAATATVHHSRQALLVELTLDPPSRTSDLAGPPSLDDDWLTLSTIHSAKGLEWRAVHLIH